MKFKVKIKDEAKYRKIQAYQKLCSRVVGFMNPQEMFYYMTAIHIMDYKILIHRMNKRIKNNASLH